MIDEIRFYETRKKTDHTFFSTRNVCFYQEATSASCVNRLIIRFEFRKTYEQTF